MKHHIMLAVAVAALGACGQPREPSANVASANHEAETDDSYSGTGTVTAVAGDQVTIDHGAIKEIGWPAMTMAFEAPGDLAQRAEPGNEVSFEFREVGSTYVLTSLERRHNR